MSAVAITISNLRVAAGSRTVLSVDQMSVAEGEVFAVMGPNGAGKSTFLRTCLGLQRHARGAVRILGQRLDTLGYSALIALRRSVGYVPQPLPARSELPLTVREVVAIGRTGLAGLLRPLGPNDWRIVDEWLARLGIGDLGSRAFSEVSGGEQRKAVIARAMVQEPRLLLLDEPTANLDMGWRERIVETIHALHTRAGLTVVLVCHELEVLPACCGRVALLDAGSVLAVGSPEEVFTEGQVAALYGPGLSVIHRNGRHSVVPRGGLP